MEYIVWLLDLIGYHPAREQISYYIALGMACSALIGFPIAVYGWFSIVNKCK